MKFSNGFYAALIERGYFTAKTTPGKIDVTPYRPLATSAFAEYEANNPVGYPLAWEIV